MIDQERAERIFQALQDIREFLPEAAAMAEIAFPGAAAEIVAGEALLSKIFEVVAAMEGAASADDVVEKLRNRTIGDWRLMIASTRPAAP